MLTDGPLTPQDEQTGANQEYDRCAVGLATPPQNGQGSNPVLSPWIDRVIGALCSGQVGFGFIV